ncbi:Uncharacterised protein [Bordetella pertussis]|nr:Uncharacterised protein [Bordetella pertussis]CPM63656.1 Uncharacterised protein [Bordetella pertussis]CPP17050.1 Uncharacterised protein [Bordetella pertussis]
MCLTFKPLTANSMAALVPWKDDSASGSQGGTRLATLRTTKISPGPASKMTSGETRESQQPISRISGFWPFSANASYRLRSLWKRPCRKA